MERQCLYFTSFDGYMFSRLSKVVGEKLTNNNPDIADLSDSNRPTRLAEYFSELYDNEWTDAFDCLTTNSKRTDQHAIKLLLHAVMVMAQNANL